ncbi:MAG: uroporphyrinogen-III synthase [Bacteroidales bacterium]|jgi:uroporphyrinogen-III synthase|nr:uroporphyrinogen-III synthase [Bacteroidales bacterium]
MKVKNILISQPQPTEFEKSPYYDLTKKYSINIDFYKFFKIEGISGMEFRKSRINILDHTMIVFASKNTVDHFFQLTRDLRLDMPESMKYICTTDAVAHYLQKYVPYRKRKILFAKNNNPKGVYDLFAKNKEGSFLLPGGADSSSTQFVDYLEKHGISYTQAVIFHAIPADMKNDLDITKYDMIVFFSPYGVHALRENFPDFNANEVAFAALGQNTAAAVEAESWPLAVVAPTPETPSITSAIALYLKDHATRRR